MTSFHSACVEALTKARALHTVKMELESANVEQRVTTDKAIANGWIPKQVVDGIVILSHPNLERHMKVYEDGRHTRFIPLKTQA